MPVKRCQIKGKLGWCWGDQGKCYVDKDGKRKAARQGLAAYHGGYKLTDAELKELQSILRGKG